MEFDRATYLFRLQPPLFLVLLIVMAQEMTKAQKLAVAALRRAIDRTDRAARGPVARGRTGKRTFKRWDVTLRLDGVVVVRSCVGWKREKPTRMSHSFDDIKRTIYVGPRGGISGYGNVGHGIAGETRTHSGPRTLYRIDRERVY